MEEVTALLKFKGVDQINVTKQSQSLQAAHELPHTPANWQDSEHPDINLNVANWFAR
jgi:hypothetical protein